MLDVLVSAVQASALPVWILGGAVTASGRILADVHWYETPGLSRVVHEILGGSQILSCAFLSARLWNERLVHACRVSDTAAGACRAIRRAIPHRIGAKG